jgi:uncharacterized protein
VGVVQVKVVPGSSRNRVTGKYGEGLKVQVSAPPEKGKANEAVRELLAEFFGVPESQVILVSGQTQPRKVFRIDGLDDAAIKTRISRS